VVITANNRPVAVNLDRVHDLKLYGMTITGAARQGVWVGSSARIAFSMVTVTGNKGPGFQVKRSASLTIARSTITGNKLAGIMEVGGNRATLYSGNRIAGNGRDHRAFNGDGIILSGRGAVVRGNRITSNGDHKLYEHGIYASKAAAAYLIERNTLSGNSATGVKAQGSGTVRSGPTPSAPRGSGSMSTPAAGCGPTATPSRAASPSRSPPPAAPRWSPTATRSPARPAPQHPRDSRPSGRLLRFSGLVRSAQVAGHVA
jgi:hypothetical protein